MQNGQLQTMLRRMPTLHRISSSREADNFLVPAEVSVKGTKEGLPRDSQRRVRALAEAIILQSIEDLWSKTKRKESIDFFTGDGFSLYADMAGMTIVERLRLLRLLRKIDGKTFDSRHAKKIYSFIGEERGKRHL